MTMREFGDKKYSCIHLPCMQMYPNSQVCAYDSRKRRLSQGCSGMRPSGAPVDVGFANVDMFDIECVS